MVNDGSDDQEAVADLESVRLLLDKLTHPTPALTRLIDLVRRDPDLQGLMDFGERRKQRGSRGTRRARVSGGVSSSRVGSQGGDAGLVESSGSVPVTALLPIVVDYANGLTQVEIATKHTLHVQTVRKRLAVAGVKVRSHNRALSDEELNGARAAIDGGASARAVARDLGVAHTTLLRALKRDRSAR